MKKEQWILCGLLGALCLVMAIPTQKKADKEEMVLENEEDLQQESGNEIQQMYEEQLEETLSLVKGVGKVKVAVTMETTGQKVVEKDNPEESEITTEKDKDGGTQQKEVLHTQETTIFQEQEDGSSFPYVTSETYPEVRGVLVVAQGGDNPVVVKQIQEAVMALFHVEVHKVKVLSMK